MRILITGGAGYIGSHMARYAKKNGFDVVILDNFSTGNSWAVDNFEVIDVDLLDRSELKKKLKGHEFNGVIHFAAKSLVGESIIKPNFYFRNNVIGTMNLVDVMLEKNIKNLVFSSSAAIFGYPLHYKINEDHLKKPINPYGKSKLMAEEFLENISSAHDLNVCALRYFNAAGADPKGDIGEAHDPETHLIPNILKSCINPDKKLNVYGDNYETHDGTCIRDYVHVYDLAQAHLKGLEFLYANGGFHAFNLGNEDGYSILDVIKTCNDISGKTIDYTIVERRIGDPATLVADSSKAIKYLNWKPQYNKLSSIIETSWNWHKNTN